jgi:hypothetical protein
MEFLEWENLEEEIYEKSLELSNLCLDLIVPDRVQKRDYIATRTANLFKTIVKWACIPLILLFIYVSISAHVENKETSMPLYARRRERERVYN